MCGILGAIAHSSMSPVTDTVRHFIAPRGPDGSGTWDGQAQNIFINLSHARLSIIDVSDHARQPMLDEACDWIITYNGEIFNYIEIREELRALGWSFHSASDTEVLLKAWAQWGIDALPRLNGMFAFAVHNQKTGETWLVRDRFGVKPLLWARLPGDGLVFSSSVAAVAQAIDAQVDTAYCSFGLRYKAFEGPDGGAPFEGVHSVAPGGWLKLTITPTASGANVGLEITEGRWYDLAQAVAAKQASIAVCSDNDLLEQCQHLLQDAVKLRLRSDVPLAVSLSGGLDSSTVAALAARQVTDLHGFTYGSPNALQSEGPVVDRLTRKVGITPHYIWPALDAAGLDALLERTLSYQEAPFPGLSVMAQNEVFRHVRQAGFKVLLGGQGGDEAFAGYRKFFVVAARHAMRTRDAGNTVRLLYSLGLMLLHEAGQARLFWRALGRYQPKTDFAFDLLDWTAPTANLWGAAAGGLADRQIEDVQHWSIPTLLRYEDRNSMGHGVETRLPFMDYRLVELALALPARLKIANGFGKWAVRHVSQGVVPDFIRLNRKKRGFDVTQTWIADGLGDALRARLHDQKSALAPYMKKNVNINHVLSNEALQANSNLLDEALMLAWLAEPIRPPAKAEGAAA
ncbi:asparagine synthase (glutamine-hydrolyzing) [Acidovorax sp. IB03]|uniref:asparagine synthase (glutamine-hydrolyzing) n=1 Tax=Acidovorax sp. IB03 TaxID=2779366 RepID=UPI0021078672|nr:asparagine synthase (glutamine-hydrolyzing) [Acidovorax sp. IB03]